MKEITTERILNWIYYISIVVVMIFFFNKSTVSCSIKMNNKSDTTYIHDTIISQKIKASYYNNKSSQCDDSPNITANNTKITRKHDKKAVALSRNLFSHFNMGDSLTVISPKHLAGKYLIFDKMARRWSNKVDFFTFSSMSVDSITIKI